MEDERQALADHTVEIQSAEFDGTFLQHRALPLNDLAGSRVLVVDVEEDLAQFIWRETVRREQTACGLNVQSNRAQRLIQLVREGRRHFAHRELPFQVRGDRQLLPCSAVRALPL